MSEPLKRKEWKKVRNRRAKAWKALNRPYTPIPASVKFSILTVILVLIVLVPMYGYWSNNVAPYQNPPNGGCPSGETPKNGICAVNDPYTLLWNGTITGTGSKITLQSSSLVAQNSGGSDMGTGAGLVYTTPIWYGECWKAPSTTSIVSFVVYLKKVGSPTGTISAGILSPGGSPRSCDVYFSPFTASSTNSFDASTLSTSYTAQTFNFAPFSIVNGNFYTTSIQWNGCGGCSSSNFVTIEIASTGVTTQNGGLSANGKTLNDCASPTPSVASDSHCPTTYDLHFAINSGFGCSIGFQCFNSGSGSNNFATLISNSTFPSVMLTNSSITISTAASKELLFYETWNNNTNLIAGQPFAWYLTTNSTLPNTPNYNPLTDTNVAMVAVYYPGTTVGQYYVYQQKDAGSSVLGGGTQNPYPICPQTSTLYACAQNTMPAFGASFRTISTLLNYTGSGSNSGGAGSGSPNANSLMCIDQTPANLNSGFCTTPGNPQSNTPCSNPSGGICTTNTFPFLNVQGNYYLGFWSSSGQTAQLQFGTANSGAVDKRANAVYYWIPNPSCPPTCAQTDTGGFFGWLGKTVNGAVNTVFTTVQNVATWTQNTALGPIGNVLQGLISWLITQLVNFINWVGGVFLGNSSLGTQLLTSFNNIIGIVTRVLTDFVTWFTQFGLFVQSAITLGINIFANTVVFGILGFFANSLTTLVSIVLTVITTFFSYATPTSYLLMMDWIWSIMMVYVIGVSGFLWWVDLNVQAFTFVFKMMWKFIEAVWSTIIIIKSFIPTEGGTQGTVNNPIPTSGGRGGAGSQSGSQGKPAPSKPSEGAKSRQEKREQEKQQDKQQQGKVPKLPRGIGQGAKDGDPMAIVVMSFLIIVLLYWLSQSAFSPVATVQTAGCYAWSTNCHLQNGIMVGSLDTTVFFSFLFSTSHGIFVLFTLAIPLIVIMFARWFQNNVIGGDDDDGEEEGNMFFNW